MSKPRKRFAQTLGFHSAGVAPGRWGVPRGLPGTLGGLWGPGLSCKKKKRPSASVGFQSFIKGGRAAGGLQGSPFGPKKILGRCAGSLKSGGRVGLGWVPGPGSGVPVPGSGSRGPGVPGPALALWLQRAAASRPGSRGPGPGVPGPALALWLQRAAASRPRPRGPGPGVPGPALAWAAGSGFRPRVPGPGSRAQAWGL